MKEMAEWRYSALTDVCYWRTSTLSQNPLNGYRVRKWKMLKIPLQRTYKETIRLASGGKHNKSKTNKEKEKEKDQKFTDSLWRKRNREGKIRTYLRNMQRKRKRFTKRWPEQSWSGGTNEQGKRGRKFRNKNDWRNGEVKDFNPKNWKTAGNLRVTK